MSEDICAISVIHQDSIDKAKREMTKDNELLELSELLKMFSDFTRIKILTALITTELCVCDIAGVLDMSQSSISHQLRVLKQAKLVKYRKEGKVVYYSIHDNHVKEIIVIALEHIREKID